MGCFLACFGSSKNQKRRKHPNHASLADPNFSHHYKPIIQSTHLPKQDNLEKPISLILHSVGKPEVEELSLNKRVKSQEQLNSGTPKKVIFDSNITVYDHVSVIQAPEILSDREKEDEKGIIGSSAESTNLQSVSENGSTLSSLGSYPHNHRYQNCRESDDEDGELGEEESDLDDEDDENDDHQDSGQEFSAGSLSSMESKSNASGTDMVIDELNYSMDFATREEEMNSSSLKCNARDRSHYVHSVLNPVENVTQWKAVKANRTPLLKQQKENFTLNEETRMPFIKNRRSKQQPELDDNNVDPKNVEEISVAASLSTWLVSSQKTPTKSEDGPILGAITADELKQFSLSFSPKRSPSQSKGNMPIISTVGAHWNSTKSS